MMLLNTIIYYFIIIIIIVVIIIYHYFYYYRGISEIIEKIINFKKKGDLLEIFIFEWMKIRIAAAMSYDQSSAFTLCRLLGFDIKLIPEKYKKIFKTKIDIFEKSRNDIVVDIVGSSRDNMK